MQSRVRRFEWNFSLQASLFFLILLAGMIGLAVAYLSRGLAPTGTPQDTFYLLDNAWHLYCGQHPYNDFFALTGTLYAYLVDLCFLLHGPTADAIAYSLILPAVVFPAVAWIVARRRFGALESFLFSASVLLIILRPSREESIDYAGVYNNVGAGIWLPFLLALAYPLPSAKIWGHLWAGAALGATAFLLWQAKISFGVYSLGLLVLSTLFVHRQPVRLAAAIGAWIVLWAAFLLALHIPLHRVLEDSRMITSASSLNTRIVDVARTLRDLIPQIVLLASLAVVVFASPQQKAGAEGRRRGLIMVLFAGMGIVISTIGGVYAQYVDLLLCMVLLADHAERALLPLHIVAACWIAAAGTLGFNVYQTAKTELYSWPHRAPIGGMLAGSTSFFTRSLPIVPLHAGGTTIDILVPPHGNGAVSLSKEAAAMVLRDRMKRNEALPPSPVEAVLLIEDGLDLLAKNAADGAPIVSLQWSNPFSFLLRRAPAKGDIMWWDMGRTISVKRHPTPESILAHAGWVMDSRLPSFEDEPTKAQMLRERLQQDFVPYASSDFWTLWKRR
jgi:hypothetical protein